MTKLTRANSDEVLTRANSDEGVDDSDARSNSDDDEVCAGIYIIYMSLSIIITRSVFYMQELRTECETGTRHTFDGGLYESGVSRVQHQQFLKCCLSGLLHTLEPAKSHSRVFFTCNTILSSQQEMSCLITIGKCDIFMTC